MNTSLPFNYNIPEQWLHDCMTPDLQLFKYSPEFTTDIHWLIVDKALPLHLEHRLEKVTVLIAIH